MTPRPHRSCWFTAPPLGVHGGRRTGPAPTGSSSTGSLTRYDEVVMPQPEGSTVVAPNVRTSLPRDLCPTDRLEHISIIGSAAAIANYPRASTTEEPALRCYLDLGRHPGRTGGGGELPGVGRLDGGPTEVATTICQALHPDDS